MRFTFPFSHARKDVIHLNAHSSTSTQVASDIYQYDMQHTNNRTGMLAIKDGRLCVVSKRSFIYNFRAIRHAAELLKKAEIIPSANPFKASFPTVFKQACSHLGNPTQANLLSIAVESINQSPSSKYIVCKDQAEALTQQSNFFKFWPNKSPSLAITMLAPRTNKPIVLNNQKEIASVLKKHIDDQNIRNTGWGILEKRNQSSSKNFYAKGSASLNNSTSSIHKDINASLIKLTGNKTIIATAHPTTQKRSDYFSMLEKENPSVIFELMGEGEYVHDLDGETYVENTIIEYDNAHYTGTSVHTHFDLIQYDFSTTTKPHNADTRPTIPLVQVLGGTENGAALKILVTHLDSFGGTPLLKSSNGGSRAGTLIVAKMILDEHKKDLVIDHAKVLDLVMDIRKQHSPLMVGSESQLAALFELADLLNNELP